MKICVGKSQNMGLRVKKAQNYENSGPFFVFKMAIDHFLERKLA